METTYTEKIGHIPMPSRVENGKYRFNDLNTVIDRVHSLFEAWENESFFPSQHDGFMLHRTKLAVHEWVANLVQFADFRDRNPEIQMEISPNGKSVHCIIEDNSAGFDLDTQISIRKEVLNAFPERGMGLLILTSIADELIYRKVKEDVHRLEFTVTENKDPWFKIPF